jgi:hypothetical protein
LSLFPIFSCSSFVTFSSACLNGLLACLFCFLLCFRLQVSTTFLRVLTSPLSKIPKK